MSKAFYNVQKDRVLNLINGSVIFNGDKGNGIYKKNLEILF